MEPLPHAVVDQLGLAGPEAVRLVGGRVSTVWRAMQRGGAPVAVRRSPWFRGLDEVRHECALLLRLAAVGAPVAPPVDEPATIDGAVWVAFTWVEGVDPIRPVEDPAAYGRLLAGLHDLADGIEPLGQRPSWGRVDEFLTLPRAGGRTLAELLSDFSRDAGPAGTALRRIAEGVHERLAAASPTALPSTAAHGDFGPHQILETPSGPHAAIVLDWDFTHDDLRLADLAIATSLSRPTADRAAAMLGGYLAATTVDPGDLMLLPDLRRAFHLNNLANQVCALWANGVDISAGVATISERLDRERWWGPTLLAAAGRLSRPSAPVPSAPVPRSRRAIVSDLDVAHELADRASIVAMHHFVAGVVADTKADDTPVTEADGAVELLLREGLSQLRPGDGLLGEELGPRAGARDERSGAGAASRTWILDPIDGTSSFAAGDANWRIHLALQIDGELAVAVVDAPAQGVRWWATRGGGAFEAATDDGVVVGDPIALRVSSTASLEGALVGAYPRAVAARLPPMVAPASPTVPLPELIRGEVDAYLVDCCFAWDHAPWILLVREAGGAFTDHHGGGAPDQRGGLYSNGVLHDALLAALDPPISRHPSGG